MGVCVLDRQGNWVFACTALVIVWTAVYLTGYSDYVTDSVSHFRHLLDVTLVSKKSSTIIVVQLCNKWVPP